MADCGVCIGGYDSDGPAEFYETKRPRAKKEHKCEDCDGMIAVGQTYRRDSGKFDGEFFDIITCNLCDEIRSAFTCAENDQVGPPPGELWSDIQKMMFPHLTTACFDKLHTPEAKAFLQRRWMEWIGLATQQ